MYSGHLDLILIPTSYNLPLISRLANTNTENMGISQFSNWMLGYHTQICSFLLILGFCPFIHVSYQMKTDHMFCDNICIDMKKDMKNWVEEKDASKKVVPIEKRPHGRPKMRCEIVYLRGEALNARRHQGWENRSRKKLLLQSYNLGNNSRIRILLPSDLHI